MEIPNPAPNEITVYSKSGCINCSKVKKLLKDKHFKFTIIDCDDFILEDKEYFLNFIKIKVGYLCNIFPMVFEDNIFIGGFEETIKYLDKILEFNETF